MIHPWLVGFWARANLAQHPKTGYRFCGVLVGPRQVLTVKHDLQPGKDLFARFMSKATQPYKVVRRDVHSDLDIALLTVEMDPGVFSGLSWHEDGPSPAHAELVGVFDGEQHSKSIRLAEPDVAEKHRLFVPEQAKGVSGGAVLVNGQLWGLAVQRYAEERIGCAIPLYLVRDWLRDQLKQAGVGAVNLPPTASTSPKQRRLKSLAKWLCLPDLNPLRTELFESANDANGAGALDATATPAEVAKALASLARHRTEADPIAGIHLTGRALKRARGVMAADAYTRLVAPHIPDLVAAIVGEAFDCECAALEASLQAPTARVQRTPFANISLTALLAAQLFEGQLKFIPTADGGWSPQWVFELNAPENGEKTKDALYREAYRRFVGADTKAAVNEQRESRALTDDEMRRLRRQIQQRIVEDESLVVLVHRCANLQLSPSALERARSMSADLKVNLLLMAADRPEKPTLRMAAIDFEEAVQGFLEKHAAPAAKP